ncbi:MAG: lytic transglycosylase domain-containing protein [Bacteroidetes bacterium]|nr:lytic transglycosylase domain-containing protein [Bacteroidota bacterium]
MALYTTIRVKIPDLQTSFKSGKYDYSDPSVKDSNINTIKSINRKYGAIIDVWGGVFLIPNSVIIGLIGTESGGEMTKPNKFKATGLMQVTPRAVWESVRKWDTIVGSPLPSAAVNILKKNTPEIFTSKSETVPSSTENKMLTLLEKDANFNIMTGTLLLRWLLERFSTQSTGGQLNKAMVAYNAGAYIRVLNPKGALIPNKIPVDTVSLATNRAVPKESRGYLYKTLGKDGFLSLIIKDRVI